MTPDQNPSNRPVRVRSFPPDVQDKVCEELISRRLVNQGDVAAAYRKRRALHTLGSTQPVWRIMALNPALDKEQIYAIAADMHGYKTVSASRLDLIQFVRSIVDRFSEMQWRKLGMLGVVPVGTIESDLYPTRWVFGTFDPTIREAHQLARDCSANHFELRYLSHATVAELIAEVFLTRLELPPSDGEEPAVD
ncbi:MAG: hypothetical protein R2834_03340 [Rhodothermales bacterium]